MTTAFLIALICSPAAMAAYAPVLERLRSERQAVRALHVKKCLPELRYAVPAREVAVWNRAVRLVEARRDKIRAMYAGAHRCRPTDPRGIIRYVFPDSTEDAAIRVAGCETGWTFWPRAHNPSGASGLFQLMPFHWVGKFDPFDPWLNSRYALRLSDGGTNWSAWVCRP